MNNDVAYGRANAISSYLQDMADGCGDGMYRDRTTGKCRKSITTHPERRGTYGKGFLSESQSQEYEKINEVEKKESPQLVVSQTAAMNSWTSHDDNGQVHEHAHNDLEYAESLERKDPKSDPRGRSPGDRPEINRGDARQKGPSNRNGGDTGMVDSCPKGQELVHGYKRADGTEVDAYCRDAHDHDTAHDKREDHIDGEIAGKDARGWEDRDKRR